MDELKSRISQEMFDSLMKANITSLEDLLRCDSVHLGYVTSLSPEDIKSVLNEAAKIILGEVSIVTANEIPAWDRISTGCKSIDSITRGGMPINGITEIFGCGGVGKTQFCLQLSLMSQLHQDTSKGVIFLCTDEVFPSKRFIQLAEAYRHKYNCSTRFEDNVYIEHIADYEQLRRNICVRVPRFLQVKNIILIVIDSIAGVFRSENDDISYASRSQEFVTIVTKLNKLCLEHHVAILCTNQVTENIDEGKIEPCLGLAWSNLVNCRFGMVRNNESSIREFEVVFAPDLQKSSCSFMITELGLVDTT